MHPVFLLWRVEHFPNIEMVTFGHVGSFGKQSLGLLLGTLCQFVVITRQCPCCRKEHTCSLLVEHRIASGESPHVVGCTTALAVGRNLVGFQTGVIVQSVGNGGSIAQMVVVVKHRIGQCLCHVSYLFSLSNQIQHTMFDKLQNVGCAVRTVQVNIALLFTDKGLITLRLKEFPCTNQILYYVDIRTSFDIKVTGIKETANIQSRDKFQGLVFSIGSLTL